MKQFIILFKKDLLELFRTKKILIISFIFILFALLSPILAKMMPEIFNSLGEEFQITMAEPTIIDSNSQFVSNICQLCLYALIITFGGLIVNERRKGLYTTLLNNGVKKHNFVLSKLISQIFVTTIIYVISVLLFSTYNYVLFENFIVDYSILSFISLYIYLIFVVCCVNFFSTISKTSVTSIILGFTTTIILALFDLVKFGKYLPNYLLTISTKIFNDSSLIDIAYKNIAITLVLSLILIIFSIKLCNNKE